MKSKLVGAAAIAARATDVARAALALADKANADPADLQKAALTVSDDLASCTRAALKLAEDTADEAASGEPQLPTDNDDTFNTLFDLTTAAIDSTRALADSLSEATKAADALRNAANVAERAAAAALIANNGMEYLLGIAARGANRLTDGAAAMLRNRASTVIDAARSPGLKAPELLARRRNARREVLARHRRRRLDRVINSRWTLLALTFLPLPIVIVALDLWPVAKEHLERMTTGPVVKEHIESMSQSPSAEADDKWSDAKNENANNLKLMQGLETPRTTVKPE
jgi:hypothetical protein